MTAIEIAIEALTQARTTLKDWALRHAYIDEALAVLTAEPSPVPPDRERNTGLVCDAESYLRQTGQTVYADAVASLLRQPAPAEVEALAKIDALRKAVKSVLIYRIEDDDRVWLKIGGQVICATLDNGNSDDEIAALLRFDAEQRSLLSEGGGE